MKIPDEYYEHEQGDLVKLWMQEAYQVGVEAGVYVVVAYDLVNPTVAGIGAINRIYFRVLDHEFESLNDLKKAIANKVFL